MSDTVIRVENLSKLYRIGKREEYRTLRDAIVHSFLNSFHLVKHPKPNTHNPTPNSIWALKDVGFEIKRGEVVGIIGRNGAGKTTLLKILSRITEPTEGYAEIRGRVGSLLEVGTGFHAELTGRENIYLNGAILGMKKAEIERKFDEIVAFAEIEKFIDTPVKHYSSGMYVRLAFAVAAHLEPEILLVDEVLAVGDAAFQKKCMGKMGDVAREGRTVVFVSHNMGTVTRLCTKTIWLDAGYIQMLGATEGIIAAYLSMGSKERGECQWVDPQQAPGDDQIRLRAVRVRNSDGEVSSRLDIRLPFYIEIEYEIFRVLCGVRTGFRIITADGTVVFTSSDSNDSAWDGRPRHPGKYVSRCKIPGNLLNEGQYALLNVWADIPLVKVMFLEENLLTFYIEQTGGVSGRFSEKWSGVICPALPWTITIIDERG
jgi:lipopolysaccharide transport system ATP-binding protein